MKLIAKMRMSITNKFSRIKRMMVCLLTRTRKKNSHHKKNKTIVKIIYYRFILGFFVKLPTLKISKQFKPLWMWFSWLLMAIRNNWNPKNQVMMKRKRKNKAKSLNLHPKKQVCLKSKKEKLKQSKQINWRRSRQKRKTKCLFSWK